MGRLRWALLWTLLAGCSTVSKPAPITPEPGSDQRPVALLGAAYDYVTSSPLITPPRDLHSMGDLLLASGYDVRPLPDLRGTYGGWQRKLVSLSQRPRVVFFYSGHGLYRDPLQPTRGSHACCAVEGKECGSKRAEDGFSLLAEEECSVPARWITGDLGRGEDTAADPRVVRIYLINACFAGLIQLPRWGAHYLLAPGSSWVSPGGASAPVSPFIAAIRRGYLTGDADLNCDDVITVGEAASYVDGALRRGPRVGRYEQVVVLRKNRGGDPVLFKLPPKIRQRRRRTCRRWSLLKERLGACAACQPEHGRVPTPPGGCKSLPRWCLALPADLARKLYRSLEGRSPFPLAKPVWLISGSAGAAPWARSITQKLTARGHGAMVILGSSLWPAPDSPVAPEAEANWIAGILQRFAEVYTIRLDLLEPGGLDISIADHATGYQVYQRLLPKPAEIRQLLGSGPRRQASPLGRVLERGPLMPIFPLVAARYYAGLPRCPATGKGGQKYLVAHFLGRVPRQVTVTVRAAEDGHAARPCETGPMEMEQQGTAVPCDERQGTCYRLPLGRCACQGSDASVHIADVREGQGGQK